MRPFEIGLVLPTMQFGPTRETARWPQIREIAMTAESMGADTVWVADELLWRADDGPPRGAWDGLPLAGAVAAVSGSTTEIAASLGAFRAAGFTQVDLMVSPGTLPAFEALAPVVEQLRAERP